MTVSRAALHEGAFKHVTNSSYIQGHIHQLFEADILYRHTVKKRLHLYKKKPSLVPLTLTEFVNMASNSS